LSGVSIEVSAESGKEFAERVAEKRGVCSALRSAGDEKLHVVRDPYANRLAALGYRPGQSVWVPVGGAWTEGTVASLGISFVSVVVKMPDYKRLFQFRAEEIVMRDPELEGADRRQR
jgi:hypothetical protein